MLTLFLILNLILFLISVWIFNVPDTWSNWVIKYPNRKKRYTLLFCSGCVSWVFILLFSICDYVDIKKPLKFLIEWFES